MKINNDDYCFICGVRNPIGLKLKPVVDQCRNQAGFDVVLPDEFQGWQGFAHGGIIAALLDEVSAYAAMTLAEPIVTAELDVRYHKPVPIGREIRVQAQAGQRKGRVITVEAEMSIDGVVHARAAARMVVVRGTGAFEKAP